MRRALLLLASLSAVTALALWLARVGGMVEVQVGEIWVGITFPIAVMLLAAAFALFHTVLTLFGWLAEWLADGWQTGRPCACGQGAVSPKMASVLPGIAGPR